MIIEPRLFFIQAMANQHLGTPQFISMETMAGSFGILKKEDKQNDMRHGLTDIILGIYADRNTAREVETLLKA